ncbi:MAG: methylcrotonoyl-CoA carboxylase, partial [Vogesella sp.]
MPIIESKLSPRAADFQANADKMRSIVADLKAKVAQAALGGGSKARDKHVAKGKLLPRERIDLLLDPGAPFLELSQLAAFGMYNDDAPGAG